VCSLLGLIVTSSTTEEITYVRPSLYPKQEDALFNEARYSIVEASTKAGKTVGCLAWIVEQAALKGGPNRNFWWVAPVYPVTKIAFRRLKAYLPEGMFESNESEVWVKLANGSVIWFKSGDKPDSLFGEDVYGAVIDEATRVKAESWHAIRSTLTATQAPIRIIGNVKGSRNWAYKLARKAESGADGFHYAKLTVWDAVEAGIFPAEEAEDAKALLPDAVFRELYLAEAADQGDRFFNVDVIGIVEGLPDDVKVCRVWDFAITDAGDAVDPDWTAGVKLASDGKRVFIVDVVRRRERPDQITALVKATAVADGTTCAQIIEEEKGAAGAMMVELFKRLLRTTEGTGRVIPAKVTGDKATRAFHFAADTNDGNVYLVKGEWNEVFLEEMDDFPLGDHDDQVDAAAHGYNYLKPSSRPRVRWL